MEIGDVRVDGRGASPVGERLVAGTAQLGEVGAERPGGHEVGVERPGALGLAGGAVEVALLGEDAAEQRMGAGVTFAGGVGGCRGRARGGFGIGGAPQLVERRGDAEANLGFVAVDGARGLEVRQRVGGTMVAQERHGEVGVGERGARLAVDGGLPQRAIALPGAGLRAGGDEVPEP